MIRSTVIAAALSFLLVACGSDGDGGDCDGAMTKLCDKACGCTSDASCALTAGAGVLTFDSRDECLDWYVGLACTQADQAPDGFFTTCSAALDTAECQTDPSEALIIPDACILDE